MYTIPRCTTSVRNDSPLYGLVPRRDEAYAAAGVLHDLAAAPDAELPIILARYAALRAWTLRSERAPAAVVAHALSAAAEHLASVEGEWRERRLLREALRGGVGQRPLTSLWAAAAAAEEAGHPHGARALREAVHRHRLLGAWLTPFSTS